MSAPLPPPSNQTISPPPPLNQTISPPPPPDVAMFSPPERPGALSPVPSPGGLARGAFIGLIAGVVIGAVSVLVAVGFFVIVRRRRMIRRKRRRGEHDTGFGNESPKVTAPPTNPQLLVMHNPTELPLKNNNLDSEKPHHLPSPHMSLGLSKSTFTYEELYLATDGFADTNLLGQGGFGYVHKGILPNGTEVAIKQLKAGSGQGEREFQAEVEIISRIHHKHLVSLVGYCISGIQRMLVYEFVANDTLEFHLHGKGRPTMSWEIRLRIALGSAKGLAYLHEDCQPKVIHRDIKASNILLDSNFEAKVADFGLAKSSVDADTHVSTRVMGTFGYLAPEYASSGKLTDKSDVFSFGVMLLELITGRQPFDRTQTFEDDSMIDWARPLLSKALDAGNFDSIADPMLQKEYDSSEMGRMVACAAVCVRYSARRRPRMSQVVRVLEGNLSLDNLHGGNLLGQSTGFSSFGSSDYDIGQYNEDMRKFRKLALETQEHSTSELSGSNSEFTLQPSGSNSEDQQTTLEPADKKINTAVVDESS